MALFPEAHGHSAADSGPTEWGDPRGQGNKGTASEAGMKLQAVFNRIWIGPGDEVKAIVSSELKDPEIADLNRVAVLNVADDYVEYPHPGEVLYVHAGLNDGPPDWDEPYGEPNSVTAYAQAVRSLDFLTAIKDVVLVHCHGGVSRSAAVVSLHCAMVLGTDFETALTMLKAVYPRANPHPKHALKAREVLAVLGGWTGLSE